MVETITPAVHGSRRSYRIAVALHATGAAASGAILGALLGTAGGLAGAPWGGAGYLVLAVVAAAYLLREALGLPLPLPQFRRQVPEWWRRFYSPKTAALLYGLALGVGFATYLSFGAYAAVAAGAFLSGSPVVGAAACGAFGFARGLSIVAARRTEDEEDAARLADAIGDLRDDGIPRGFNAVALALVAAAALVA